MENYLFIESKNSVFVEKQQNKQTINSANNPNFKLIAILLLVLCLIGFSYIFLQKNKTKSEIQSPVIQNSQRLETLIQKALKNEQLTESEWSELCQLLSTEKSININDCENCRDYIRAKLGGKHKTHLQKYQERSDKEIRKGINSYQKQIDLHKDKIINPEKYYPGWKDLDIRQQKDLVDKKWNEDIIRLQEQKEILNCILKNR